MKMETEKASHRDKLSSISSGILYFFSGVMVLGAVLRQPVTDSAVGCSLHSVCLPVAVRAGTEGKAAVGECYSPDPQNFNPTGICKYSFCVAPS